MNKPTISIIAAIGKNRELGKNNKLLWNIPDDLKRFRKLTTGHAIIMGRKTYESIGKPLPNRQNIIITRDKNFTAPGCTVTASLEEALNTARQNEKEEIFIIGGGQIYAQAIDLTNKLYLTYIDATFEADTYFPEYKRFKKIEKQEKGKTEKYTYTFIDLTP